MMTFDIAGFDEIVLIHLESRQSKLIVTSGMNAL